MIEYVIQKFENYNSDKQNWKIGKTFNYIIESTYYNSKI